MVYLLPSTGTVSKHVIRTRVKGRFPNVLLKVSRSPLWTMRGWMVKLHRICFSLSLSSIGDYNTGSRQQWSFAYGIFSWGGKGRAYQSNWCLSSWNFLTFQSNHVNQLNLMYLCMHKHVYWLVACILVAEDWLSIIDDISAWITEHSSCPTVGDWIESLGANHPPAHPALPLALQFLTWACEALWTMHRKPTFDLYPLAGHNGFRYHANIHHPYRFLSSCIGAACGRLSVNKVGI